MYEPVDSETVLYYREAKDGQILEEGITEAGSMSSFIAAGTSYSTHGINMIPFFIFYSMFGFQRIGDLIWSAADSRCKGFILGGTAGRTTLNGEGLQHQDGHSHLFAMAYPTVRCYDPAYAYETACIVLEGMRLMYEDKQDAIYYITIQNENYLMPNMPQGCEEGIIRGMYRVNSVDVGNHRPHVQLFGCGLDSARGLAGAEDSGREVRRLQHGLERDQLQELRTDAQATARWNMLHPEEPPRKSYLEEVIAGEEGPFIATSDNVRAVAEQIDPWLPGGLFALGTDGLGRSDQRENLRRHFEIDAETVTVAACIISHCADRLDKSLVAQAIRIWASTLRKSIPGSRNRQSDRQTVGTPFAQRACHCWLSSSQAAVLTETQPPFTVG